MLNQKVLFTVRNSSCGKVMFSQASVILSTAGGRAWQKGGHAWQWGHLRGERGCMHGKGGGHVWQERRSLQRTVRILFECILVFIECAF